MAYNVAISRLQMPARIAKLPVDERGYPVPKFVTWHDGKPDFRVVDPKRIIYCHNHKLCWICGDRLGRHKAFVIGPMCAINRVSSEPPSHLDCAQFAVKGCPFLAHPERSRDDRDLPEGHFATGGIPIYRNPGVTLIWVCTDYKIERAWAGNPGALFKIGEPTSLLWYARGRTATRDEIMESINSGLPKLREAAEQQGREAVEALDDQVRIGLALVPAT